MIQPYSTSFTQLETTKNQVFKVLSESDSEYLITRKNGKWAPLEHCYHVHLAEMYSRKYCQKKLSFNPELKDASPITHARVWAMKAIELTPFKFKAPKAIDEQVFPEDLTLDMVQSQWSDERLNLKDFLERLDPALAKKEIYKQPTVGRLTINGMLQFFQFHLDRHIHHMRRDYQIRI